MPTSVRHESRLETDLPTLFRETVMHNSYNTVPYTARSAPTLIFFLSFVDETIGALYEYEVYSAERSVKLTLSLLRGP